MGGKGNGRILGKWFRACFAKIFTLCMLCFSKLSCAQLEPDFFFFQKNEFLSKAPWLLLQLIKNSQSAICRVGKPGIKQLGSLYKQNKTPKKKNKKADKQCKLSHKAHTYFSPVKMYHKKSCISCGHNDAKFWLLWQIIPSLFRRRQKSFVAHQKKLAMRAEATDTRGGRISCEQTLNKFHSPPSPKYTILAIKTDLHSMHASVLSIQDHLFQWETGRAVFWIRKL